MASSSSMPLRRSDSVADMMPEALRQRRYQMKRCFQSYVSKGRRLMKNQQLMEELETSEGDDKVEKARLAEGFLGYVICSTQEAVVLPPLVAFAVRTNPGVWEFIRVHSGDLSVEQITPADYLKCKETLYDEKWARDDNSLEVDFGALDLSTPHLALPSSIGNGMQFISRFMSSKLSGKPESMKPLLDYLLALNYRGEKLMISDSLDTADKLQTALLLAEVFVASLTDDMVAGRCRFQEWGLEKGWGDTAETCRETLNFLSEVLQAPDPINMEKFFSRVPSVFNIVIFSIHGYFGQEKVLGLPDTGGQVVYILDQVRALEEELLQRIKRQGLNVTPKILVLTRLIPDAKGTKCNVELEPVEHTKHSSILRVPFKTDDGKDLRQWVSRFDIYPYLERYAKDSSVKILDILEGKPDMVIGNYTDGNLVASLLSSKLGVTQGTIAHLYLIIDTVVLMVNSCKVDKLHNLQQELVRKVTHLLYEGWSQVRLLRSSADCGNWKDQLQSKPYEISEAIFRLSMDLAYPVQLKPDEVRKSFFGQTESDFQKFTLMYWENSPYLYRKKQSDLEGDAVFTALHNAFDLRTPDAIIESFIHGLVSCPAIASDELNINSFLHEVHDSLGAPVKYRQDVRVVRTPDQISTGSGVEEHFFDDGTVFPDAAAFVEKCKGAIKNGFSIALRGMEFRSEKIAAVASALADLFGQPSVGANIYFSPPRSQGLARHYDDHCVLVWQLLGCKKWKIWPNTRPILPRLYEPFHSLDGLVDDSGGRVEVLHEGDIMYVPRGHVHEAHTDLDEGESEVNASTNYSLHLTLAIEVEPPFEWEGFAHIALHCWLEEQELVRSPGSAKSKVEEQAPLFALLLHVAIRLLSDDEPTLRKACMATAKLPSLSNSLRSSHRSIFADILDKIGSNNNLKDALRSIELAVKARNDEPFQWMSWLRHLPQQHGRRRIDFSDVLGRLEELIDMFSSDRERASSDFADFRSSFCGCAVYDDARREFEALLVMYRTARTRYAKGMLALHGKHGG